MKAKRCGACIGVCRHGDFELPVESSQAPLRESKSGLIETAMSVPITNDDRQPT